MRRVYLLILVILVGLCLPARSQAQPDRLCFNVPNITNCIEGRFRQYWEQNGGLDVFGYPITPAREEQTAAGTFLVQYFERNRFELHPEKAPPYDVLLGRLGDDELRRQELDWQTFMTTRAEGGCLWFEQTRQALCDSGAPFKTYWESHGLLDPALNAYQRSLALFGMPLSSPQPETNAAGDTVITQWFERARFEYHPTKPERFRVLLGLLGNEARSNSAPRTPRLPTDAVWLAALDEVRAVTPSSPAVTISKGMGFDNIAVAPDGSLIVFYQHNAIAQEGGKLWAIDVPSGQRRVLFEVAGMVAGVRFSPDASRLVFAVVEGFRNWQLVEIDLQKGNARTLQTANDNAFLAPHTWTTAGLVVTRLRWGTDAPPEDVILFDLATGATRVLYRGWHWGAAVSRDAKRVAVVTGKIGMGEDPEMSLSVVDTDTGRSSTIVSKARQGLGVVGWSQDGSRLLYRASDRGGNDTLHVVTADASRKQSLDFSAAGTTGRLMDVRWRDGSTLLVVTATAKVSTVHTLALGAFTVAGLQRIGAIPGGIEAPASPAYIPRS